MAVACPPLVICCVRSRTLGQLTHSIGKCMLTILHCQKLKTLGVCKQHTTECKYGNRGMSRAESLNKHGLPHGFFLFLSHEFSLFLSFSYSLSLSLLSVYRCFFFKRSGGVCRLAHEAHTSALCFTSTNSSPLTPGSQKKSVV